MQRSGEECVGRRGVQWKEKEKGRRDRRKEGRKECFFLRRWQLVCYYAQESHSHIHMRSPSHWWNMLAMPFSSISELASGWVSRLKE